MKQLRFFTNGLNQNLTKNNIISYFYKKLLYFYKILVYKYIIK